MNPEIITKTKSDRKIYSRDDMISYFYCPKEIPIYLKEFPCLVNDNVDEEWYKKPLPKFEAMSEGKQKPTFTVNKYKDRFDRQRSTSNQSGDIIELDQNLKYRTQNVHYTQKFKNDKFNRFNLLNDSQTNTPITNEVGDTESDVQTLDSKAYKMHNLSKPYVSNYQGQENHWKKWSKDRNSSDDKNKLTSSFVRVEKTNNFVVRKAEADVNQDVTKLHTSRSYSTGTGLTEDIWQDDWDTEMQSQIAQTGEQSLDGYELPPSCIAANNVTDIHSTLTVPSYNPDQSDFDQWFYIDLSNQEQGPFPSDYMANWFATGYFDSSTKLRRQCDTRFLIFAEYRALYGRIPFTAGSTIAPILDSTTVDIDQRQLTAGLDRNMIRKVLTNATCLSSQKSQFIGPYPTVPDNDVVAKNDLEKLALLEDKRKLEETKAELERQRQQLAEEQEQWKLKMQKELEVKMETIFNQRMTELNKTVSEMSLAMASVASKIGAQSHETVAAKKPSVIDASLDSSNVIEIVEGAPAAVYVDHEMLLTEDLHNEDWQSMKDSKANKKNKKLKNKATKVLPEPVPVPVIEIKKSDNLSKVVKESGFIRIVHQEMMDEMKQDIKLPESPRPESLLSWNMKPTVLNVEQPKVTKTLLEIQAEETEKTKTQNEIEKALNLSKMEANKVTSFKQSLLKSVGVAKTPVIPSGKSIWDVATADNVQVTEVEHSPHISTDTRTKVKENKRPSENYERNLMSNNDGLLDWCARKLSKYDRDLDVFTVVELLKEVPSENVMELTEELLDDSSFSRDFARDFVKKRQEMMSLPVVSLSSAVPEWKTVKKQSAVPDKSSNNGGQSGEVGGGAGISKRKAKKVKMTAVDMAKFNAG